VDDKAFVRALGHRQGDFRQAVGVAAARAGEMGMALAFGATTGKLKMPGSLIHKSLMYQANSQQTFEGSVDCDFIEVLSAKSLGNLIVAERPAGLEQHLEYGDSAGCAIESGRFEHLAGLSIQT
jgi:hypothetical protein